VKNSPKTPRTFHIQDRPRAPRRDLCDQILAGIIAGAACTAAACSPTPTPGTSEVPAFMKGEARVAFVDNQGQKETVLTIGKGSICAGIAEGKSAVRRMDCSFQPGSGTLNGENVTAFWEGTSGSQQRSENDAVTTNQELALRVVKSEPGGYDCRITGVQVTATGQIKRGATNSLKGEARDQARVSIAESASCSPTARAALETTLARLRRYELDVDVACW
jgi:hypothetical protein